MILSIVFLLNSLSFSNIHIPFLDEDSSNLVYEVDFIVEDSNLLEGLEIKLLEEIIHLPYNFISNIQHSFTHKKINIQGQTRYAQIKSIMELDRFFDLKCKSLWKRNNATWLLLKFSCL